MGQINGRITSRSADERKSHGCVVLNAAVIRPSLKLMTFVNVMHVNPSESDDVLSRLAAMTDDVICGLPGFLSASLHRSEDRARVMNYAQWADRASFEAMFDCEDAIRHMQALRGRVNSEKSFYDVVSVHLPRG